MFSLSLRDVELILAERGVLLTYETIRRWCQKFGRRFAEKLRKRRPRPGDRWHLTRSSSASRRAILSLACRGSERCGARHPGPEPTQRQSREAFLQAIAARLQFSPRIIVA